MIDRKPASSQPKSKEKSEKLQIQGDKTNYRWYNKQYIMLKTFYIEEKKEVCQWIKMR